MLMFKVVPVGVSCRRLKVTPVRTSLTSLLSRVSEIPVELEDRRLGGLQDIGESTGAVGDAELVQDVVPGDAAGRDVGRILGP
jgi:hypothetical protein